MSQAALRQAIVARIRTELEAQGLSVRGLAAETGIPHVTLQRRMAGLSAFDTDELHAVGCTLGVEVLGLMTPAAVAS